MLGWSELVVSGDYFSGSSLYIKETSGTDKLIIKKNDL